MPLPPLSKAHVNAAAGLTEPPGGPAPEEIERRVQELWNAWLKQFFGGAPFHTPVRGGGTESKTFEACDLIYDQATPPAPLVRPLLHLLLADRRDADPERGAPGMWSHSSRFVWNFLVRAHPDCPVVPVEGEAIPGTAVDLANRQCRRIGDELSWLLKSVHAQQLSLGGILELKVENGPRQLPAGAWIMRQLVVSARVRWETENHEP